MFAGPFQIKYSNSGCWLIIGKMCPRIATVDFQFVIVRERETVTVCYFYILCTVGVVLSLRDHKVMVILCL